MAVGVSQHIPGFCGSSVYCCLQVCACKGLSSMAEMVPVAPTLCSGRFTWNSMILQALAIWCFIDYRHKLAATARSVLLYMCVHPLYKPQTTQLLKTKGKYTVLLTILKESKQTKPKTTSPTYQPAQTSQKNNETKKNQNKKPKNPKPQKNPQTQMTKNSNPRPWITLF